jgi:hypothetical protein
MSKFDLFIFAANAWTVGFCSHGLLFGGPTSYWFPLLFSVFLMGLKVGFCS